MGIVTKQVNRWAFICLAVLVVLTYLMLNKDLDPFEYELNDDFYSYVYLSNLSQEPSRIVVGFGVFNVETEAEWIHVHRMKVSILECPKYKGLQKDGTLYEDVMEYWALNKKNTQVYGPMNKIEEVRFLEKWKLKGVSVEVPKSYSRYSNNLEKVCGDK